MDQRKLSVMSFRFKGLVCMLQAFCAVIYACGKERQENYMAMKAKIVEDVD